MSIIRFLVLCFVLLIFSSYHFQERSQRKWVSLFNGKDLSDWQIKIAGYPVGENFGNTFSVQDGVINIRYDKYDSFKNRFGALYTKQRYTNYRLKVEYRFVGETAPGAPSWGYRDGGIQYHCQSPASMELKQSFPVCLEYNLHGGNGKDERPVGEICTPGTIVEINGGNNKSFCTPATVKRTFHGDQWVTAEIEVRSGIIRHFVNGEEILQFKNPRFDPKHAVAQKFIVNGKDAIKEGFISLQTNSHPMDFRRIEILELRR